MADPIDAPATAAQIRAILGHAEDELVAEILRVGASEGEVLEAFARTNADDSVSGELDRAAHGRVIEVMAALERAGVEDDEA